MEAGANLEQSSGYDTPMMKQHREIKTKYPDTFLFFRCGDFYELFAKDALEAAKILDITLTKRQNEIPMCGVPYHAADVYINKMIKAGKKVAICEQLEDPKLVKGLVKRGVTEIITPGTVIEEKHLANKANNYLLSLNIKGLWVEIAYLDVSTGDFGVSEVELSEDGSLLKGELFRILPREILIPENIWNDYPILREIFCETENILINRYPAWYFDPAEANKLLLEQFHGESLRGIGIPEYHTDFTTPGVLLKYLKETFKGSLAHLRGIRYDSGSKIMLLDESTIKHLELIRNQNDGTQVNSLLEILDQTVTSMGGRLLKKWIVEPLIEKEEIEKRLNIVEIFFRNSSLLEKIDRSIKNIIDLERLASRLVMDKATPKDLIGIKQSLTECSKVKELLQETEPLRELISHLDPLSGLVRIIEERIKEEPATFIDEGNIIRDGFCGELDELKSMSTRNKEYITGIEGKIKTRFNVPSLKIKYNKILGYFFELSKNQSVNLDESFILRQSLVNSCRYTNKELSEYESKVLTARERINEIERNLFLEVKEEVLKVLGQIQENAAVISQLDVLLSFAKVSMENRYTRPMLDDGYAIHIEEGRHPVVEKKLDYHEFIPNDTDITQDDYLMIITGPNMAGKSTFLRQNALIVLLAQIGCFVPAASAQIGIVDRIFTRIGTSDNLARGQSTFFVEMQETANILRYATGRSLIIMDEIGRGTSTYDGLAIAWAVLEYIQNRKLVGAKTLFATHYHELTELAKRPGFKNYSVAVSEEDNHFTFLHKIIPKAAERSYGIHVAKLAGIPEEIVHYAEGLLKKLENQEESSSLKEVLGEEEDLFGFHTTEKTESRYQEIIKLVRYLDLDRMTPIQSLNTLHDLQKKIRKLEK